MKLAGDWLLRAMSENGQPSARRVVMVVGLLVFSPLLLTLAARFAPASFAECFIVYMAICGCVYVGGSFANRGTPPPPPVTP
jgi:hypothetical protein